MRKHLVVILVVTLLGGWAGAADFPLEWKTFTTEEAPHVPGGGAVGGLYFKRPGHVTNEPKAVSRKPLYGAQRFREGAPLVTYRLDESKGTARGYDRLIFDLNNNGDLRDDPAFAGTSMARPKPLPGWIVFGPIEPETEKTAGLLPSRVYAIVELQSDELALFANRDTASGILRLHSAGYLEATVEIDGAREKVGLVDRTRNGRLTGGSAEAGDGQYLPLDGSDALLRDRNGSGCFDLNLCETESDWPADLAAFGANIYRISLAKDCRSVHLERYTGPTGRLKIAEHPERVHLVRLERQLANGRAMPFAPVLIEGTAVVPAGTYEFRSCALVARMPDGSTAMTWGMLGDPKERIEIEAGQTKALRCGPPLEIRIDASKTLGRSAGRNAEPVRQIDLGAALIGTAGEQYIWSLRGVNATPEVKPPRFRVFDENGSEIGSGQFEYG